jgi:uncharacterized protein
MTLLILSILALLAGPAIYASARGRDAMLSLLDGLIFVSVSGLVLLLILPESFETGGWAVLVFAVAGVFGPTFLEGLSRQLARRTHVLALILGLAGLALHATIDGTALSHDHLAAGSALPAAVVLHRFPVGLAIWWLLRPAFGFPAAAAVLGLIAAATLVGFNAGPHLTAGLSGQGVAWFQALVAGMLLHVVFHQPHLRSSGCDCREVARFSGWYEGVGALLGVGLTAILLGEGISHHGGDVVIEGLRTFLVLARESAPALLIAYLMAGAIHSFLPVSSIRWLGRGSAMSQSVRGMAVGLPLPVCSCGVVPIYQSLIRRGVPPTAGISFLVATPELGVAAVLLSIPLLGGEMTLIRVGAAIIVAAAVGRVVGAMCRPSAGNDAGSAPLIEPAAGKTFSDKVRSSLAVGLGDVVDRTAPWILLGLAVAAVAQPFLSAGWPARIPDILEVPLFALVGLPAYVCASGATPIVAVLLAGGVSPGAALAFLLTGPATNVTTFGVLAKLHGRRIAFTFSCAITGLSIALGYVVNWVFPFGGAGALDPSQDAEGSLFQTICLALLIGVFLSSVLRRGARRFVGELLFPGQRAIDLHPHYHN